MSFLDNLLGGGGTTQSNTTTAVLTPQDQAGKDAVFQGATNAFNNATATQNAQGYAGPKFIAPSADTTAAQNAMRTASGTQQQIAGAVPAATQFGLADVLNIAGNQNLTNVKDQNMQAMLRAFSQAGGPLSQIRGGSVQAGGFGGSRQGIAEGLAMQGLGNSMANANANFDNAAYAQALQTFNQTLNSLPTAQAAVATPASTLAKVGANVEGYQQGQENYDAAARDFAVNKDWSQIQNLANIIYGGMTPGTSSTAQSTTKSSGAQQLGTIAQIAGLFL